MSCEEWYTTLDSVSRRNERITTWKSRGKNYLHILCITEYHDIMTQNVKVGQGSVVRVQLA